MQQVDRNRSDPLDEIACLFDREPKLADLVRPDQSKTNPVPSKRREEVCGCDSPGPVAKPGFIRFLFTPEDTTDSGRNAGWTAPVVEPWSAAGTAKVFFWIIMAILFSLLLTRLH